MNQMRFIYLRNDKKMIQGCIATALDKKGKRLTYGVSILNPRDNFNRKVARDLAVGRIITNGSIVDLDGLKTFDCHNITRAVLNDLLLWDHDELPSRARKAARRWLRENKEFESNDDEMVKKVVSLYGGKVISHQDKQQ